MNTQPFIKAGQRWTYVGKGNGRGTTHVVLMIWRTGDIATWSVPERGEVGGYSWLGPASEFKKAFSPIFRAD